VNPSIIFSIIAAVISVGGIFIAIGVFKGKINHNAEEIATQEKEIKTLASKDDLAAAIKRSDEMLEIMRKRAEEDRAKGQGQYREFSGLIHGHDKRITALETQQTALEKTLEELKLDIKSGFKDVQTELKGLQNEIKELRNLR
jgi:peptidoglycan hydrolase CwlO-like protein